MNTTAAVRLALQENGREPEGPARNARAEQLVEEAGHTGDTALLIDALFNLLSAYNFSSESEKMFVPFARVLRMWDERPGDFDEFAAHRLHWMFKWVSSGMLDQPGIPLASVEKWQAEMEHRYRLAGHSERAVRQGEFRIARDTGDLPRAERAFAAWLAADRDGMSDCHACELNAQGAWLDQLGRPAEALETWAPVLAGEFTCAHEPHVVLASSLLPLVRLGRTEEARTHHLRGYRMIRDMESMRSTVADHIEFCALTGNEARGLELLAEHTGHFAPSGDPDTLLGFLAAAALLARRLGELGLGEREMPGPAGRVWTADALHAHARAEALALAARFDARNGSTVVGARVTARMDAAPLLERLPLGVRAERLTTGPRPAPVAEAPPGEDVGTLLATARRLTEEFDPGSRGAWDAAARAAGDGAGLDALARAELAGHAALRGTGGPEERAARFREAAALYEEAGRPVEAAGARARHALALALLGDGDEADAPALVDAEWARLRELDAPPRRIASVMLHRCRVLLHRLPEGSEAAVSPAELERAIDEVLAYAEEHAEHEEHSASGRALRARVADAFELRGAAASAAGDPARAAAAFARAAEVADGAGLSWYAAGAREELARAAMACGDPKSAIGAARSALEHGAGLLADTTAARLHLILSDALSAVGERETAVEHALEAAHWADRAGQGETLGAWARLALGGALHGLGRADEAASVLETVLPDLERQDDEGQVVRARWWLGECLAALRDHRQAAEQFLRAAGVAQGWDDQEDHAVLANLAADCLDRAGLDDEAERAYERAGELWRGLDRPEAAVRVLRARAWVAARGEDGLPAARELMAAAVRECTAALGAAGDEERLASLRAELAQTHRQFGELVVRSCPGEPGDEDGDGTARAAYEEGLAHAERAVAAFAACGPALRDQRTAAQLMAAWLEADLGRAEEAAARARAVAAEYGDEEEGAAPARRAEAGNLVKYVAQQGG
ncbi:tetratricopeptide repeat protein [Streptomyces luteireticuli]|uniref:tetratricopeptide repeat protein n=1 Tax=Streptomyces luteireticuli TaxID=173858 RepID=UPI003557F022